MKNQKILTTLVAFTFVTTTVPSLTSCTSQNFQKNDQTISRRKSDLSQQIQLTNMLLKKTNSLLKDHFGDQAQLVNNQTIDTLTNQMLLKINELSSSDLRDDGEVATIQRLLQLMPKTVMFMVDETINSWLFNKLFSKEDGQNYKKTWEEILNGKIDFVNSIKKYMNLKYLFNALCNIFGESYKDYMKIALYTALNKLVGCWYTGINVDFYGEIVPNKENEVDLHGQEKYTDKYNWDSVKQGDIVYSDVGFDFGFWSSGHCGIVDGWKTDINGHKFLRIIEANQWGVAYGIVDENRLAEDKIAIYSIADISDQTIASKATEFVRSQMGKPYNVPLPPTKSYGIDTESWYCSEIVWAGYNYNGYDVQSYNWLESGFSEPGATPHNLWNYKNKTVKINF